MPTDIIILLFLVLEDRATVGTDPSANIRFMKESDARVRHSFYYVHGKTPLSFGKLNAINPGSGQSPVSRFQIQQRQDLTEDMNLNFQVFYH